MSKFATKTVFAALALAGSMSTLAAPVPGMGTWESTLLPRDIDGNGTVDAYYDTVLNLSWLANADPLGAVSFSAAAAWAADLNVAGVTGWQLPSIGINGCGNSAYDNSTGSGFANDVGNGLCGYSVLSSTSDMAHLYNVTLANPSYYGTSVPVIQNTGPFDNLAPTGYWFSRVGALDPFNGDAFDSNLGWRFSFYAGRQDTVPFQVFGNDFNLHAWAVHSGDVGSNAQTVPEPTSLALIGLGVFALVSTGRRKRSVKA